jgi:hypothetical protein
MPAPGMRISQARKALGGPILNYVPGWPWSPIGFFMRRLPLSMLNRVI